MSNSPKVSESMREHLAARANEYHSQLRGSAAEKYLMTERGFTQEAIDFFSLGYVETPMKGDQMHAGRIVIPYQTRTGVVALRSRSLPGENGSDAGNKYLPWMTGDVTRPFNTTALDTAGEAYIIEGEFDTITAWMLGLYAVGVAGVNNWKSVYKPLFRYRKNSVIADNDDQGQGREFAKLVAGQLGNCSIILCDKGYDLNSMMVEKGVEYCKKLISGDSDDL